MVQVCVVTDVRDIHASDKPRNFSQPAMFACTKCTMSLVNNIIITALINEATYTTLVIVVLMFLSEANIHY